MPTCPLQAVLFATLLICATSCRAQEPPAMEQRTQEIAQMLPELPQGAGKPIGDRAAWEPLAASDSGKAAIARAESLLTTPLPEQPDDLFLDFSRTGNRSRWQNVAGQRRGRIPTLTLAECLENTGRFLPALEEVIRALCAERTWVMPAHDGGLANFNGKTVDIDLASSALGWELAQVDWLLGDKLTPEVRALLRDNCRKRVLDPFLDMVNGKRNYNWWLTTTNNWNAVCLAGVTGTALALSESREERARFIAEAERLSLNFLKGFTPDGYCSEGLGYWNYGFGNYVLLSEAIWQATGGKVDLITRPEARMPASFGARIQIIGGVSPAFADCGINTKPDRTTLWYVSRRLGLGLREYEEPGPAPLSGGLTGGMLWTFGSSASQASPSAEAAGYELRTYFDRAGILISRPALGSECRMGVALKGGHNNEHHNHNDVGSYVVVVGDDPILLDPGAEVYTARTFSARRYESKLLNSFGHPVPVVAGKLQSTGQRFRGEVLAADFTDTADTYKLSLKAAYEVPELTRLERTWVYSREGQGSLTLSDHVAFESPQTFEVPLITLGQWKRTGPGTLEIWGQSEAIRVEVDCRGSGLPPATATPFDLVDEVIIEDGAHPTRIAIRLQEPVTEATVTVKVTPITDELAREGMLRNGSFERGSWGWSLGSNQQASISTEQAASGEASLKITDASDKDGSNITSAKMTVGENRVFEVRGKSYHVSGEGIGIYVHYLDADGNMLNDRDARGNIAPVGSLKAVQGQWEPFAYRFTVPEGTTHIRLWIHSYSTAKVEAYLDDLEVVPSP